MKKHYLSVLLMLVFMATMQSQDWWEAHPSGYNEVVTVFDVELVDENTIWTCSFKGNFSGNQWSMIPSNLLSKSTDAGMTWEEIEVPMPGSGYGVSNVSALNGDTAWIALHHFSGPGGVLKTTDGGATWLDQDATTQFTNFVHFWDANKGFAMGDKESGYFELYTTDDGGDNWERVPEANMPVVGFEFGNFAAFDALDNHIWFGTTSGNIFHSNDYGHTWTSAPTAIANTSYSAIEGITFRDSLHGIAHSAEYNSVPFLATIVLTEDGGNTWTELPVEENFYSIFQAQYIPNSPYLIKTSRFSNGAGPFLTSLSTDDGVTWTDVDFGTAVMRFEFLAPDLAWGGKFKNNDNETQMYRYTGITGILNQQPLDVDMSVFPNPTAGVFNLDLNSPDASEFLLLVNNIDGRLLHREVIEKTREFDRQIDLQRFPSGTYFVTVSNEKGSRGMKVVKK